MFLPVENRHPGAVSRECRDRFAGCRGVSELPARLSALPAAGGGDLAGAGGFAATGGEVLASSGGLSATGGEVLASGGEVAASPGGLLAASGGLFARTGEVLATSGGLLAIPGERREIAGGERFNASGGLCDGGGDLATPGMVQVRASILEMHGVLTYKAPVRRLLMASPEQHRRDLADEGALRVLEERERMVLVGADRDAFLEALISPPEPTGRLVAALQRQWDILS